MATLNDDPYDQSQLSGYYYDQVSGEYRETNKQYETMADGSSSSMGAIDKICGKFIANKKNT